MLRRLLFANFKRVYRLSQWMRLRFTSSGILILFIMPVAGVFGFDTRATLSFQIFSVTLILLLTAMLFALLFRGQFSIVRKLPDYGTVGTPLYYSCIISNKNKSARRGLVLIDELRNRFPSLNEFSRARDPLDKKRNRIDRFIGYPRLVNAMRKSRGATITPVAIDYIAEHSDAEATIQLTPLRRGYLYFEKTRLAQADPLGLFQAQKSFDNKNNLLVLPKLFNTPRLQLLGKRTYQHGGVNSASIVGDSQEFISLRDYRPGDPLRSIHWRSFAKLNRPIVKEYQDEYFIRYGLILDTYLNKGSDLVFEDAVSVAASFMSAQKEQDALLDLMFIGNNTYRYTSGRGLAGTENTLEILACIEPVYESNIQRMEAMIKLYGHECSALICILLDLDDARKALLKTLSQFDIPVKILLVTEAEELTIDKDLPSDDINILHHHRLQHDLNLL